MSTTGRNTKGGDRLFFSSRLKAASLIIASSVMIAGAGWLITEDPAVLQTTQPEVLMAMCAIAIVFYGVFALRWMRELLRARPVIEIGMDGIVDRRLGPDTIPWSAVRDIKLVHAGRRPVLSLDVDVPAGALSRVSGLRRYFQQPSDPDGPRAVHISLTGLSGRPTEVIDAVEEVLDRRNRASAVAHAAE